MRNLKMLIEYEGTRYAGWQKQKNAPGIQECLEKALGQVIQDTVKITGAGRTDAGVHAAGQVAHVHVQSKLPAHNILRGTNSLLPPDISIVGIEEAAPTFNARYDARLRWYRYQILNRQGRPALYGNYFWHVPQRLNIQRIQTIAHMLQGEHDFSAFRSQLCTARRTVLTMQELSATYADNQILIDLRCRSFLHTMVRIIVGLMVEVGKGKFPLHICEEMLKTGKRNPKIPTAPPRGLILMNVLYTQQEDLKNV